MGSKPEIYTTGTDVLGRFGGAKIQSQDNCLSDNHRYVPTKDGEGIIGAIFLFPAISGRDFHWEWLSPDRTLPSGDGLIFFVLALPLSQKKYANDGKGGRLLFKLRRGLAGTRKVDVSDLQTRASALLAEIRIQGQEIAATKKDLVEKHKTALQLLDRARIEQVRAAQAASGLYWCNYDDVIATYRIARIRAMREGRELKTHRADANGKVSVRFQRGLSADKVFGGDTRLQIDPVAEAAWLSPIRSERRKLSRTNVRIRIGSKGHTPVWLELPMIMHRPLPANGIIRGASAIRRNIGGGKYRYKLTITVVCGPLTGKGKASEGAIGMDVGWRRVKEGLRVAYWCDECDQAGQLVLPDKVISQFAKVNDLRSVRCRQYNDVKARLSSWLRDNEAPQWLREKAEILAARRSPAELAGLIKEWRKRRCSGDTEILSFLDEWLRRELHLGSWEANLRDQLQRHRREIYRIFAAGIAKRYSYVFMEKLDLRNIVRKKPEETTGGSLPAGYQRTVASVNILMRLSNRPVDGKALSCNMLKLRARR